MINENGRLASPIFFVVPEAVVGGDVQPAAQSLEKRNATSWGGMGNFG